MSSVNHYDYNNLYKTGQVGRIVTLYMTSENGLVLYNNSKV